MALNRYEQKIGYLMSEMNLRLINNTTVIALYCRICYLNITFDFFFW